GLRCSRRRAQEPTERRQCAEPLGHWSSCDDRRRVYRRPSGFATPALPQVTRQSTLILASRSTFDHFSLSALMKAANCSGDDAIDSNMLGAITRSRKAGSLNSFCTSALILPITSRGVPAV